MDRTAEGESTIDYCSRLQRRRWSHEAKGRVLLFPRTELVMVPYRMHRDGSWSCVVVIGNDVYRPDGYSLSVGPEEITTAIEIDLVAMTRDHHCCYGPTYCARCQSDPDMQAVGQLCRAVRPILVERIAARAVEGVWPGS